MGSSIQGHGADLCQVIVHASPYSPDRNGIQISQASIAPPSGITSKDRRGGEARDERVAGRTVGRTGKSLNGGRNILGMKFVALNKLPCKPMVDGFI